MQACITKFFKPYNSDVPYYEYVHQKDEAERKAREEAQRKLLEERQRLIEEKKKKQREELKRLREEEKNKKEALYLRKCEGKKIVPELYLGGRLVALNFDWLSSLDPAKPMALSSTKKQPAVETPTSEEQPADNDKENNDSNKNVTVADPTTKLNVGLVETPADESDPKPKEEETFIFSNCIRYILNVTHEVKNYYEDEDAMFVYKRISLSDSSDEPISQHFDDAIEFLTQASEEQPALVHCQEGQSRSPTIVIAYLMKVKQMPLSDALKLITEQNGGHRINDGFMQQLTEYEITLFGKSSVESSEGTERRASRSARQNLQKGALKEIKKSRAKRRQREGVKRTLEAPGETSAIENAAETEEPKEDEVKKRKVEETEASETATTLLAQATNDTISS